VSDDLAVLTTVDVFTPIVDDPFVYGQIAAINSLSDIYAMGGRPVSALAVAGFPDSRLPLSVLSGILKGLVAGAASCRVPVVGGHTVKNPEPLFGLAVTGIAHPDRLVLKSGARVGDLLVLTKPIGIGVLTTALKNDRIAEDAIAEATALMLTPNDRASQIMLKYGAHAATDVTGFGLMGHAVEMARGAGLTLELHWSRVPLIPAAVPLARAGLFPGGARTNLEAYRDSVAIDYALAEWQALSLADPQTSGGLLIAFAPERAQRALSDLAEAGVPARTVGRVSQRQDKDVVVSANAQPARDTA